MVVVVDVLNSGWRVEEDDRGQSAYVSRDMMRASVNGLQVFPLCLKRPPSALSRISCTSAAAVVEGG